MANPSPPSAGPPGPEPLRLALLGLPGAGKTTLLRSLCQAEEAQRGALGGKLLDPAGALGELRRGASQPTAPGSLAHYRAEFQPTGSAGTAVTFIDCDGRDAAGLLASCSRADGPGEGPLEHEVARADALLLAVDANASAEQMQESLASLAGLLSWVEESRGGRTEIAGLPVFLVLTHCDLLARPGDNHADWIDRVEERKQAAATSFRAFLTGPEAPPGEASAREGFGLVDLHVWATASGKPALSGTPARPGEPFGVAELFRQAVTAAAGHREAQGRSQRRLRWLSALAAALLLGMLGLSVAVALIAPTTRASELASRAEELRDRDRETAPERLRPSIKALEKRHAQLKAVRSDPGLAALPPDLRAWVEERESELSRYLAWYRALLQGPGPEDTATEEGLDALRARLQGELRIPEGLEGTPAAALLREQLATADAMSAGIDRLRVWYRGDQEQAESALSLAGSRSWGPGAWSRWATAAQKWLAAGHKPPFLTERLCEQSSLTFEAVTSFERSLQAWSSWEAARARFRATLDACAALGLVRDVEGRPPALVFPIGFTLAKAEAHLKDLRTAYPAFEKAFTQSALPPEVREAVAIQARAQYENLLAPGREEVLAQYRSTDKGKDAGERWRRVRGWLLGSPAKLAPWRTLAMTLLRLEQSAPKEPVEALAAFLAVESFTFQIDEAVLDIPRLDRIEPAEKAPLVVHVGERKASPALSFTPRGEGSDLPGGKLRRYTYQQPGRKLTVRPGELVWAEVPLQGGKALAWWGWRSPRWSFEGLTQPPSLVEAGARPGVAGSAASGVTLRLRGESLVPPLPDLLPASGPED
jgi:hypothetical protein